MHASRTRGNVKAVKLWIDHKDIGEIPLTPDGGIDRKVLKALRKKCQLYRAEIYHQALQMEEARRILDECVVKESPGDDRSDDPSGGPCLDTSFVFPYDDDLTWNCL